MSISIYTLGTLLSTVTAFFSPALEKPWMDPNRTLLSFDEDTGGGPGGGGAGGAPGGGGAGWAPGAAGGGGGAGTGAAENNEREKNINNNYTQNKITNHG